MGLVPEIKYFVSIPLINVCTVIHYLLFIYKTMNIFTFFLQNFSKIFLKTHQIAPFSKISQGSMPPNPLAPTFTKIF